MSVPENDPRLRDADARARHRAGDPNAIDPDASPDVIESQIDAKRADISRTLSQLEQRFSPNQMMDYVRDNGGEMAQNLGRTFRDNPVPFIVTGVGLAWLMSATQGGGGSREERDYRRYRSRYYGEDARYGYGDDDYGRDPYERDTYQGGLDDAERAGVRADAMAAFGPGVTDTTPYSSTGRGGYASRAGTSSDDGDDASLLDKARAKAGEIGSSIGDGVDSLKDGVSDGVDSVKGGAGAGRDRAAEHYERMRTDARYRAESLRRDAARRYEAMRRSGRDAGYRARRGMEDASEYLQEQPLVAAAVGIAIGALIGSLLPATRTEDRYLGEYADDFRDEATSAAAEQAERLKAEASKVARSARESAEQGLTEARKSVEGGLEQAREAAEDGVQKADAKADEKGRQAAAKVDDKTTTDGSTSRG